MTSRTKQASRHLPYGLLIPDAVVLIEWPGIGSEDGAFAEFEKIGSLYRRLYFFRASCVTLYSCNELLNQLMANATFKEWLASGTAGRNFIAAKTDFGKHERIIKKLRNRIGAHAELHIGEAVHRFESDDVESIELHSDDVMRPHLATRIVLNAILDDCPKGQEDAKVSSVIGDINTATKAMINALTEFVAMYSKRYPLLPG